MTLMDFSIFPLDKGESLSSHVARVLQVVESSGLPYRLGPMGTTVEGDFDALLALLKDCRDALRPDCRRVYIQARFDDREGAAHPMEDKVRSLEQKGVKPGA